MLQTEILKRVIEEEDQKEPSLVNSVLKAFVETMAGPMIERYSLYPAKGTTRQIFAHNADQTMLTHLLNGIFPTLNWVRAARKQNPKAWRNLGETELKIYLLAYSVHDLDKILNRNGLDTGTGVKTAEVYGQVIKELELIGARNFLPEFEEWISEITWLAVNTQRSRSINLSETSFITAEMWQLFEREARRLPGGVQEHLRDLCTYSDQIAYLLKSPEDALYSSAARRQDGFAYIMRNYGEFSFVYHKLAEVRGFLSNLINNATMRYIQNIYGPDQPPLIPFLFFPNGVVYLNPVRRPAAVLDWEALNQEVKREIRDACTDTVAEEGAGFGFSALGLLKYPDYFHDFLKPVDFLKLFARKTISDSKENVAESTLQKMQEMQRAGRIPASIPLDYYPGSRVSMLGRFLINYTRLLAEHLDKTARAELEQKLIARFGEETWAMAQQIPGSGGLDYRYYWLAAQYLKPELHPLSPEQLEAFFYELIDELVLVAGQQLEQAPGLQGPYLRHLPEYLASHLSFGFAGQATELTVSPDFSHELTKYLKAKQPRESQLPCTICNSSFPSVVQEEASALFQPWVYKNRLPLYKGSNAGGICSICSLELMLRQVLLTDRPPRRTKSKAGGDNQGRIRVTGKKYEAIELKYFFIYPAFFFTTQTARLAYFIIDKMQNLKLFEVARQLSKVEVIHSSDILSLSFFNPSRLDLKDYDDMEQEEKEKAEKEKGSMYLLNRNEQQQYGGFIFFAKKTFSRESGVAATTASWVEAAWLGLALPLVLGARVVVSEMYMPLFNSAADFKETVVLDAPNAAVRYLLRSSPDQPSQFAQLSPEARLRLDELYGPFEQRNPENEVGGSLAAFSRAIEIHIDTEAANGDPRLGRFSRVARELATDKLWVFSFLAEQVREHKWDSMPPEKAHHYTKIYEQLGGTMTNNIKSISTDPDTGAVGEKVIPRHRQAVKLYLEFYSPFNFEKSNKYPASRTIVLPVEVAAKRIISDTINLSDEEIKLEMRQELHNRLDRIRRGEATGRPTARKGDDEADKVRAFVNFFYDEVFMGYAEGQRSLLNTRLNRFKNGCEAAHADIMYERRQARQKAGQTTEDLPDPAAPTETE